MKKVFALLLATAMCFSPAACGGTDTNNSSELRTSESGTQQEQSSNKTDNETDINEIDVVGTWKNTSSKDHGYVMTINTDGTGTILLGDQELTITWTRTNEELICNTGSKELTFKIRANDDLVEMRYKDDYYVVVSEQNYDNIIECTELTLGNWQNYLEVRPYAKPGTNAFDEIDGLTIGCALVLKAEYVDKLVDSEGAIGYTIKLDDYNEYGFRFGLRDGCYGDSFEVNGDIVRAICSYYENIEITKIQGKIYFKK